MKITKTKAFEYLTYGIANLAGRLRTWLLGKYAIAVVYDSENGIIMSGPSDVFVGGNLGFRGYYEPEMVNSLIALTTPESRVLILGTHVGSVLIPLAKKVREVVAYEANPKTYRMLAMNLKLNDIENCQAHNFAVSDKGGTLEFMAHHINSGGSKRKPSQDYLIYKIDNPNVIEVPAVRLDDHLADPKFDLVLVDIEGSEYFAFQGMQKVLATCNTLQFEFLPDGLKHIANVTVDDFANALGDHFSEVRVQGTERVARRGEIRALLHEIYAQGHGVDILATK